MMVEKNTYEKEHLTKSHLSPLDIKMGLIIDEIEVSF